MYRLAPLVAAFSLAACSGSAADAPVPTEVRIGGLTAGDREALHSLDRAYVKAWREDGTEAQAEALLKLFAPDAIVYPGRGRGPLSGVEELRAIWFPEGAPPTRIEYIDHRTIDVEGSVALAAITGYSEIAFVFDGTRTAQRGHYIIHARPDAAGHWKIERMMWSARAEG